VFVSINTLSTVVIVFNLYLYNIIVLLKPDSKISLTFIFNIYSSENMIEKSRILNNIIYEAEIIATIV